MEKSPVMASEKRVEVGTPCYLLLELKGKELYPYGNELNIYNEFKPAKLAYTKAIISNVCRGKTLLLIECLQHHFLKFELREICLNYNLPIGYRLTSEVLNLYDYSLEALMDGLNR